MNSSTEASKANLVKTGVKFTNRTRNPLTMGKRKRSRAQRLHSKAEGVIQRKTDFNGAAGNGDQLQTGQPK